jgi:hypothetical protein
MIRALIFDFNGVLADDGDPHKLFGKLPKKKECRSRMRNT